MVNKLISKIKTKIMKNKDLYPLDEEYMFSTKEIEDLNEQNKQKLENLKKGTEKQKTVTFTSVSKKLNGLLDEKNIEEETPIKEDVSSLDNPNQDTTEELNEETTTTEESTDTNEEKEEVIEEEKKEDEKVSNSQTAEKETKEKESYINLSSKTQAIIMKCWNEIDLQQIDKDIIEGKDLLNHNYNITYGESAAKFVHDIRKKYEIVICYLIGFNNEKKGILNKTIFADRVDDEWKHLSSYIKLLEKIRNFRK